MPHAPVISDRKLAGRLAAAGLPEDMLRKPVSRARDGAPSAPLARYFVIHDTSAPWLGDRQFPAALDSDPRLIRVESFLSHQAAAHAFVGRTGIIRLGHDFEVPWRATKRERLIGVPAKGLFLHVENIQPRRRDPNGGPKNDAVAPVPGLSTAQYQSLALLYVVASVRAGNWLIPAFHAALDDGIAGGHDDPQNFDVAAFDQSLSALLTD